MFKTWSISLDSTTPGCRSCNVSITKGRPDAREFNEYISWFLEDNPTANCSKRFVSDYLTTFYCKLASDFEKISLLIEFVLSMWFLVCSCFIAAFSISSCLTALIGLFLAVTQHTVPVLSFKAPIRIVQ